MTMAGNFFYLFLLAIFWVLYSHQNTTSRVQTTLGGVLGTAREAEDGKKIYSFQGIPYIKPPVGELRFRPPQPADPWTGDFSAVNDMTFCIQHLMRNMMGSEDCIILNVYTPWDPSSSPPAKPLSVMVFIHGGGFVAGSSSTMFGGQPDFLVNYDVVLVTINYRLGVMGFLSTEDSAAPGNYGFLDQIEALKWIKNNIAAFGGNPDEVTIFGESAGAGSVHFLMLSPLAKGLFHRVIAQSGSSVSPFTNTLVAKSNAQTLARKVGCPDEPSEKLVECLREVDATKLVGTDVVHPGERMGELPYVWAPRIDSEAAQPFIPKHPIDLMRSGEYNKVPLLIGHTRTEGATFMLMGKQVYEEAANAMTNNWDDYCKLNMAMREFLVPESLGSELCNQVKRAYIDPNKNFEENKIAYADLFGDSTFMYGTYKSAELMSKHSPVYNYLFNYESENFWFFKLFIPESEKVEGVVSHAEDLLYLFKYPQTQWTKESPEYEMVKMMSKIWTDFSKTGEPSIRELNTSWPKAKWPNHRYVVIDTKPSVRQNYRPDKMRIFNEIFSHYVYKSRLNERNEL